MEQSLNQYRIFYTAAKKGNISRAAEELYISQPAISKAISKLEEELSAPLFFRNSRGVTLTPEGKALYERLSEAFAAIEAGEEEVRKMRTLGIGHLTIGTSSTFCKYLLLPYLKGFIQKYPHIRVTIETQSTIHTTKLLENKQIDVGLIVPPQKSGNLELYPLGKFQDIFVATDTYLKNLHLRQPSGASEKSSLQELFRNANLMLLDEENVTRMFVDEYLKAQQIEINRILEVNSMDLLIDFAKIGLGVACVIKEFINEDLKSGRITEIPLPVPMKKRSVSFARYKNTPHSEAAEAFWKYLDSVLPL